MEKGLKNQLRQQGNETAYSSRYTLICPLYTLTGIDMLELLSAEKVSKKFGGIQLLACLSKWNGSLDKDDLVEVTPEFLNQVVQWRDGPEGARKPECPNSTSAMDIASGIESTKVLIANLPGERFRDILRNSGKQIIDLGEQESALEEVAEYFGLPLSEHQIANAAYHKDYIPGLKKLGVNALSLDEFKAKTHTMSSTAANLDIIAAKERRIEGNETYWRALHAAFADYPSRGEHKKDSTHKVNIDGLGNLQLRYLDELLLVLAPAPLGEKTIPILADYLCRLDIVRKDETPNSWDYSIKPKLILYSDNPMGETVKSFEFIGLCSYYDSVVKLINGSEWKHKINFTLLSGSESCYLYAEFKTKGAEQEAVLNQFIDKLLSFVLVFSRPLRHYGCTFFLPLSFKKESSKALEERFTYDDLLIKYGEQNNDAYNVSEKISGENQRLNFWANETDAYLYLHPEIRKKIFVTKKSANRSSDNVDLVEEWRLSPEINKDKVSQLAKKNICKFKLLDLFSGKAWAMRKRSVKAGDETKDSEKNIVDNNKKHDENKQLDILDTWYAHIESLKLYRFQKKVYILSITVFRDFAEESPAAYKSYYEEWWRPYFFGENSDFKTLKDASCGRWLEYTSTMRELYRSFAPRPEDQKKGIYEFSLPETKLNGSKRCLSEGFRWTKESDWYSRHSGLNDHDKTTAYFQGDIAALIEKALPKFSEGDGIKDAFKAVSDNRMFVHCSYNLVGRPMLSEQGSKNYDALFSIATYVDMVKDAWSQFGFYAYDPEFTKSLMSKCQHHRWLAIGTRYACTDYSSVSMGYGEEYTIRIGARHVFYNYQYMLLIALFYRSRLSQFSSEINEASTELGQNTRSGNKKFLEMRKDFIHFTNVFWFHDVTSQIQGKELFKIMVDGLELQREYDFIENEVSAADHYVQANYSASFALIGGAIALLMLLIEGGKVWGAELLALNSYYSKIFGVAILSSLGLFIGYFLRSSLKSLWSNKCSFITKLFKWDKIIFPIITAIVIGMSSWFYFPEGAKFLTLDKFVEDVETTGDGDIAPEPLPVCDKSLNTTATPNKNTTLKLE